MYSVQNFSSSINLTDTGFVPGVTPTQFWSMLWAFLLLLAVTLWVRHVFKKSDPLKPKTSDIVVSSAIEGIDNYFETLMGGKLRAVYPYLMTVFCYLIACMVITFFGFESPATSIMFTIALGLVTFIGIFVIGIMTKGLWGFFKKKYIKDPLGMFSQFGPLLSLSIRLFGGTFAFSILFMIIPLILTATGMNALATWWPIIHSIWFCFMKMVDTFLSTIQAIVFVSLTGIYWTQEYEPSEKYLAKQKKRKEEKNGSIIMNTEETKTVFSGKKNTSL